MGVTVSLTFGSLFSGIGGLDLGLERASMKCQWQVEIDEYAQKVLKKHWPDVARFRDIRDCGMHNLTSVDLICGGFPCQDISSAGRRIGITGERSGLWKEFHRIICELRPRYVLVENVAALLVRGIDTVLGDLAACGYDAEWQVLSAAQFGAPHLRKRIFIVAYSHCDRRGIWSDQQERTECERTSDIGIDGTQEFMAHTSSAGLPTQWKQSGISSQTSKGSSAIIERRGSAWPERALMRATESGLGRKVDGISRGLDRDLNAWGSGWEDGISRVVVNPVPNRADRLRGLGNAVVPQIAEFIGRRIIEVTL